jgi:hypothetical protein
MMSAVASYWRQIGIQVEETPMPPAFLRNGELRAQYPGWDGRAAVGGHGILDVFEQPPAGPATRWLGNRSGYDNPQAQELIDRLRTSLGEREQLHAMGAISEMVAAELPMLMLYHGAHYLGVRRGVKALDDLAGGQGTPTCGTCRDVLGGPDVRIAGCPTIAPGSQRLPRRPRRGGENGDIRGGLNGALRRLLSARCA